MVHAILLGRVPAATSTTSSRTCFSRLHAHRELRDPAAFGGWIAAIAATGRRLPAAISRAGRAAADLPGGDAIEAETMAVLDVVRKLPEAYRETLLMRLVEGMTARRSPTDRSEPRRCASTAPRMKLLREQLGWRHE